MFMGRNKAVLILLGFDIRMSLNFLEIQISVLIDHTECTLYTVCQRISGNISCTCNDIIDMHCWKSRRSHFMNLPPFISLAYKFQHKTQDCLLYDSKA